MVDHGPHEEASRLKAELKNLDVADLALDPQNPRLPTELQRTTQSRLLRYLFDNGVLDELGKSFLDNGYFLHEPIIVAEEKIEGRQYVVLEGNRRLAALNVLLQTPLARETDLRFGLEREPTDSEGVDLAEVPSYVVPDREAVHRFLGFRHIGGIKTWSAEAKARYLYAEVEKVAAEADPFALIGRRVGSNALGVRNAFIAFATLRAASDTFGIDTQFVVQNRFGVWLRAMNSPELRTHIGLEASAHSYSEVRFALLGLNREGLAELVGDLTPKGPGEKPVLRDSRDVTIYAAVITNAQARSVLRKFDDLEVARQVVERAELPGRIRVLGRQLDLVRDEVQRAEVTPELLEAVTGLFASARAIRSIARDKSEGDANDA